jgi:hypothetical protein
MLRMTTGLNAAGAISIASLLLSAWASVAAAAPPHAGPVIGVIDDIRYDSDQYYIFGWACQQGNRSSIDVHIYANHAAGATPAGTYVLAGKTDLNNEPAVDRGLCEQGRLPRRVSAFHRDALERRLGRLRPARRVFHHVGRLHPLEQARAGHDARPDAAARTRRKLVLHVLLADRSKGGGFELRDHHGPSLLYYVRMDDNHGPYQRVLFRQKIKLDWLVKAAAEPAAHRETP